LALGAILVTCHAAHMARVQWEAGIKCLSCTAKQEGPTQIAQKCRHKFHIGVHNQVGRHGDTKRQSGAVPILLLALLVLLTSTYFNLGVLQGLNPQPLLLKASVYHSATSAIVHWVWEGGEGVGVEGVGVQGDCWQDAWQQQQGWLVV
jgi:hypothetical protein